jgi:hypothetical protein
MRAPRTQARLAVDGRANFDKEPVEVTHVGDRLTHGLSTGSITAAAPLLIAWAKAAGVYVKSPA